MEDFFKNVWQMIVDSNVLNLIGAILVLLVGWLIAVIVSSQVAKLVNRIGVDQKLNRCLPQDSAAHDSRLSDNPESDPDGGTDSGVRRVSDLVCSENHRRCRTRLHRLGCRNRAPLRLEHVPADDPLR